MTQIITPGSKLPVGLRLRPGLVDSRKSLIPRGLKSSSDTLSRAFRLGFPLDLAGGFGLFRRDLNTGKF
jgi:hypothetical protein